MQSLKNPYTLYNQQSVGFTLHNNLLFITNAAFLVGDGDDLCVHDFTSFLIVAVVSGNRKSRHFKIIK